MGHHRNAARYRKRRADGCLISAPVAKQLARALHFTGRLNLKLTLKSWLPLLSWPNCDQAQANPSARSLFVISFCLKCLASTFPTAKSASPTCPLCHDSTSPSNSYAEHAQTTTSLGGLIFSVWYFWGPPAQVGRAVPGDAGGRVRPQAGGGNHRPGHAAGHGGPGAAADPQSLPRGPGRQDSV